MLPERVIGWERLGLEDIEHRAAWPLLLECCEQRGLIEEPEHSADLTAAAEAVRRGEGGPGPEESGQRPDDGPTLIDFR